MNKPVRFINSQRQAREIGQAETLDQVREIITEFLEDHNYVSYYTRMWTIDGVTWFDVGSHTEFFTWGDREGEDEWKNSYIYLSNGPGAFCKIS